ncbi:ADP-ribosylation factor-binding protein GGA1 [Hypsibius exemplaris]|uniref:ADP-ribosylation factor-binding protein GGA1 n=1 Tax=Hypsibius exemplaris TaxID=2072580 RepID=A0A1W0WK39_HYPEX|nr:ADP-ribosylation factor-binding protein GGA1 [Hypsibius exemplaris]
MIIRISPKTHRILLFWFFLLLSSSFTLHYCHLLVPNYSHPLRKTAIGMTLLEAENVVFCLTDPRATGHEQTVEDELIKTVQADGTILAHCLRLLAHKVQSPCEREATNGLIVLESLAKRGGRIVHAELGKFRFLNELIKVVSPKYLGDKSAESVKKRTIEMLYSWSQTIRYEQKIVEAYTMLKQQGIVKDDPVHILEPAAPPPAPRAKNPVIEDEEKARLLRRLLQSKDPADMVAANRLIKSMVREDDQRMEKIIRRHSDLIQIKENAKLLSSMLKQYSSGSSTLAEREIMRQLFDSCEQHRPRVFKLAAEVVESNTDMEDGPNLADVLVTSDELTEAIQKYRALGLAEEKFGAGDKKSDDGQAASSHILLSLDGASTSSAGSPRTTAIDPSADVIPLAPKAPPAPREDVMSLFDDVFSASSVTSAPVLPLAPIVGAGGSNSMSGGAGGSQNAPVVPQAARVESNGSSPTTPRRSLVDFDAVTHNFLGGLSLGNMNMKGRSFPIEAPKPRMTLSELQRGPPVKPSTSRDDEILGSSANNSVPDFSALRTADVTDKPLVTESLDSLTVNLADIEPYPTEPIPIYQKNKINVVLHLAKNKPRSDCTVLVASATSLNSVPIKNFALKFSSPKTTRIKVLPASSSDIAAHNPFYPSPPLSEILLVAKHGQEPLRIQYQVSYLLDNQTVTDSGDIRNIPEMQF